MTRESAAIRHWLANERPGGSHGDGEAARKIGRLSDLRRTTPLDREHAIDDLNRAAYFHVQPCNCERCTL